MKEKLLKIKENFQFHQPREGLLILNNIIKELDSDELVVKVMLAISDYHTGNATESRKLAQAAIKAIKD